ncbi:MAG: peptidoglycan DD-metalloendopeptidase family protein [Candidatus Liptonbacteria bacterium]|nr:peptidoglycan DD-metalloendopeptidase family protein [Candidatus Liptonbacteria bacterium]
MLAGVFLFLTGSLVQAAPATRQLVAKPKPESTITEAFSKEELEAQLRSRSQDLERVQKELESARQQLLDTKQERQTLQREVKSIDSNIKNLQLSIRADTAGIEKLKLEILSLRLDQEGIQRSIATKHAAIAQVLHTIQREDRGDTMLATLLKSNSLTEGVLAAQALSNLRRQFLSDIQGLEQLQADYAAKASEADAKKRQLAGHQQGAKDRAQIAEDQRQERNSLLSVTKQRESVFAQQLTKLQQEQEKIAEEVEVLDSALRAKINRSALPAARSGLLLMPIGLPVARVTQEYGATAFARYGYRGKWHNGIDVGVPVGTDIIAAEHGRVVAAGDQDRYCKRGAYGKFVVINHDNGLTTLYAHLSKQVAQVGETVERGQLIGYAGKTGYATGPHLHFTVFAQPTFYMGASKTCGQMPYGGDLNPSQYL